MEWCSRSKSRKFKQDDDNKSNNFWTPSILNLFIEYAWDEKDGQRSNSEDIELLNWLKSINIDVSEKSWHCSNKLDVRIASRVQFTDSIKSNEDLYRQTKQLNNTIKWAQLVYELRKVLSFLVNSKNDINYTDEEGRTVLHVFLVEYLETITEKLSQDRLSRMKNLVNKLLARGASFYVFDKHEKSPLHIAATCKNTEILEMLISLLADVNSSDEYGNTALHIVIDNCVDENEHKCDYLEIVRNLVAKGADVNVKNNKGLTATHLAAEKFHVDMLKFLADSGADFLQCTTEDKSPLHLACKSSLKLKDSSKMTDTIDFLISRGCDIEAIDEEGFRPLHHAVEFGAIETIERLIKLEASVDCKVKKTLITPLHVAAKKDRLDVMRILVKAGADVNAAALDDVTPIFMSALIGSFESMEYLIERGADLYRRDRIRGFTLLHLVAYGIEPERSLEGDDPSDIDEKRARKFNFLLKRKFDVNDPATCGVTPLQLAVLTNRINIIRTLIEHGAKVNFQSNPSEVTALHHASVAAHLEVAEILIEAGADVNSRGGTKQWTPLHLAIIRDASWCIGRYPDRETSDIRKTSSLIGLWSNFTKNMLASRRTDIISTLIKHGAEVNAKDASGKTPLYFATLRVDSLAVEILLESGAQVNVQDNEGQLPLSNTLKKNNVQALKILLDFGADINDPDVSQAVMESNDELKNFVIKHAIKLKSLGLSISKIYDSSIQTPELAEFRAQCSEEVDAMKNHRFSYFSLHQFLHMNVRRQYYFVKEISDMLDDLKALYPIYFSIIRATCREVVNRKSLLDLAKTAWAEISKIYLPDLCVENILSFINNRYLEALVASTIPNEEILIDENIAPVFKFWIEIVNDDESS